MAECWKKLKRLGTYKVPRGEVIFESTAEYPRNHLVIVDRDKIRKKWRFQDNKDMKTIKHFESKKQAVTKAKSYMKKHGGVCKR